MSVKREAENNVEVKDELGTHEIRITKIRAQLEGGNRNNTSGLVGSKIKM